MINVYFGKAASGKDYLYKQALNSGKSPIVSATTRPIRTGEVDGVDYYFMSADEFLRKVDNGEIFEYRAYRVKNRGQDETWYYGSLGIEDYSQKDYVAVLDIEGLKSYIERYGSENVVVNYVYADDEVRKRRYFARDRKADVEEWERRFLKDEEDFCTEKIQEIIDMLGKPITFIQNNGETLYKIGANADFCISSLNSLYTHHAYVTREDLIKCSNQFQEELSKYKDK